LATRLIPKIGGEGMSERNWRLATRRSRLCVALALGGMATVAMAWGLMLPTALADDGTGCADGNVCWWDLSYYSGNKDVHDCFRDTIYRPNDTFHSAKNRCTARYMLLSWQDPDSVNIKSCLDAGENRPDPGRFNLIDIGPLGTTCAERR